MPLTNTDAVLHYDNGIFGEIGYAVPNWSNDIGTLNPVIGEWVQLVGQNLFAIMHHQDADFTTPPSRNTLERIHRLYMRSVNKLTGQAVPDNELNFETDHVRPAGEVFKVYPVPFYNVRNVYLKRWANLMMMSMSEAMQHTENRREMDVSERFTGDILKYFKRLYANMAIELFNKTREEANTDQFLLTVADFDSYNPKSYFTSTEMIDTVPRLDHVFTEDQLSVLRAGFMVTDLPNLKPFPVNLSTAYANIRTDGVVSTTGVNAASSGGAAAGGIASIPEPTL